MYTLIIALLMFICPITCVLIEFLYFKSTAGLVSLIGKWWVFWAVGVRLFTAGLRQAANPRFTAETIFQIKTPEPFIIVQELGFANISIGLLGLITLLNGTWTLPAAITGGTFYGLAGIRHLFKQERNRLENIAMLTDLIMLIILLVYGVVEVIGN